MKSPIYWNPLLYHFTVRNLYGRDFEVRYRALAELIPEGAKVTELCMGDGYLYENYLRRKNIKYMGLDINRSFIRAAKRKNITCQLHNLHSDEIPPADIILMQGSLCQFIPDERKIIRRMINASRKIVLIAEPVVNRAHSKNFFVRTIAKYSVNPGTGHVTERFNETSLLECFHAFPEFKKKINAGKEIIGVFEK